MNNRPILKLDSVYKTYVLGNNKPARKAQKAIEKLQKKYEKLVSKEGEAAAKKLGRTLDKAQRLFSQEKYAKSYKVITGKNLRAGRKNTGSVVHALSNVSLEISKGELVAIMGPSGSGKSTLLNMLGLLDQPTAGQIYINGQNVSAIKPKDVPDIRSKQLGFVFQSFNLIPTLTAAENVMLPLRYGGKSIRGRRKLAHQALEAVSLGDRLNHNSNELSGGQRQRVAIARSVVNNPAIVLGDELTGELDSTMTKEIMRLIMSLNKKGQTFIIVTHNPDVAKVCKRIIYMRDGQIEKEVRK